jgi:hypothetical protein
LIAKAGLAVSQTMLHHLHLHWANRRCAADLPGAQAIPQTLLLHHAVLAAKPVLHPAIMVPQHFPLHRAASLTAVAKLARARTVAQTLLLHHATLSAKPVLHHAITVLHHLPLHRPATLTTELASPGATAHFLLTTASSTTAATAPCDRFPDSQTNHSRQH